MKLNAVYPLSRQLPEGALSIIKPIKLTSDPFEVVVMELLKAE